MATPTFSTIAFDATLRPSGTLWLSRASLSACIRATLVRNTLGADLTDVQRLNHFPAAPLCSLTWWFSGSSLRVPAPGDCESEPAGMRMEPMPGRWVLCGPQTRPMSTWNTGPAHFMMVLIMPDALEALTGLRLDEMRDQLLDASAVLPVDWLPMLQAVQDAQDDGHALQQLEEFLDPRWQRCRSIQAGGAMRRYTDWVAYLAQRAALSGPGRSLRQLERRIKRWSGLPLRELRVMERAEEAFLTTSAIAVQTGTKVDWAQIAAETGYSDQSHMIRATRRVTGFPPEALRQGIQHEECFWAYRLWM